MAYFLCQEFLASGMTMLSTAKRVADPVVTTMSSMHLLVCGLEVPFCFLFA